MFVVVRLYVFGNLDFVAVGIEFLSIRAHDVEQ